MYCERIQWQTIDAALIVLQWINLSLKTKYVSIISKQKIARVPTNVGDWTESDRPSTRRLHGGIKARETSLAMAEGTPCNL